MAGYIGEAGEGKRGNPHRYWLIAKPPDSFLRSKPSRASEERNDLDEKREMVSSDAPYPSEETISGEQTLWADDDPFHSSDALDGYIGRNQIDGEAGDDRWVWS